MEWRKEGAVSWGSVLVPENNLLHSSYCGVVIRYNGVAVGIRGVEPRLKTSVKPSVQSHGMRWTCFESTSEFWFVNEGGRSGFGLSMNSLSRCIMSGSTDIVTAVAFRKRAVGPVLRFGTEPFDSLAFAFAMPPLTSSSCVSRGRHASWVKDTDSPNVSRSVSLPALTPANWTSSWRWFASIDGSTTRSSDRHRKHRIPRCHHLQWSPHDLPTLVLSFVSGGTEAPWLRSYEFGFEVVSRFHPRLHHFEQRFLFLAQWYHTQQLLRRLLDYYTRHQKITQYLLARGGDSGVIRIAFRLWSQDLSISWRFGDAANTRSEDNFDTTIPIPRASMTLTPRCWKKKTSGRFNVLPRYSGYKGLDPHGKILPTRG